MLRVECFVVKACPVKGILRASVPLWRSLFPGPKAHGHHPVQDGLGLEAAAAALTGAHVDLGRNVKVVVHIVGGRLESLGHGDGPLRADLLAPAAVGAALQIEIQPAHGLVVGDHDQPRGADVGAAGAADALVDVDGQLAPEPLDRQGLGVALERVGEGHPQVLEADDRFF